LLFVEAFANIICRCSQLWQSHGLQFNLHSQKSMTEVRFFDLGKHTRTITTSSQEAQEWFDLGLSWCFGFNHEEAVACFRKALELDANCAMA
jgi:hypothetical protein